MSVDPLYITIDVDWSADAVVAHALDTLDAADVVATVFVTHASPVLERLRKSPRIEVGIHPNFNPLLAGTAAPGTTAAQVLAAAHELAPEATAVRSHALVHSSPLLDACAERGFTHEVNTLIPAHAGIDLAAWPHWSGGLVRVPYLFDDSIAGLVPGAWDADAILDRRGLRVVNFHPGRLYLNQRESTMPAAARAVRQDPERFVRYRNDAEIVGSMTFLRHLIDGQRRRGGTFATIAQIQAQVQAQVRAEVRARGRADERHATD